MTSSYPHPTNLCTETVVDHSIKKCKLSHWIKPCVLINQRSSFQRLEGISGFFTMPIHVAMQRGDQALTLKEYPSLLSQSTTAPELMGLSHQRIFRRITRRMGTFANTSRSLYTSFVYAPNTLAYALTRSHTARPQEGF